MKSFGFVLFVLAAAASSVAAMPAVGANGVDIRDAAMPRDSEFIVPPPPPLPTGGICSRQLLTYYLPPQSSL